ncbi:hypothetical protein GCM10027565_38580 [Bordetella tumulicola]
MKATTIDIDLAKSVFQVNGVDADGKNVLKKQLKRDQVANFFINMEPCLIGMEACGSAHHWGRKVTGNGSHSAADGTPVGQAICQEQQERRR